jgi:hypothetical protein
MQSVNQALSRVEKLQTVIALVKQGRYAKGKSDVSDHLRRRE